MNKPTNRGRRRKPPLTHLAAVTDGREHRACNALFTKGCTEDHLRVTCFKCIAVLSAIKLDRMFPTLAAWEQYCRRGKKTDA